MLYTTHKGTNSQALYGLIKRYPNQSQSTGLLTPELSYLCKIYVKNPVCYVQDPGSLLINFLLDLNQRSRWF